jgi:hypothetical protein
MTNSLSVLVLESDAGVAAGVAERLVDAGHTVLRCHDGDTAFPCAALVAGGVCPLVAGADVGVLVRADGTAAPTAREDGVACGLRAGLAVLELDLAGEGATGPFAGWTTPLADLDDVARAATEAADASFAPLRDDLRIRLTPLLARHDLTVADVDVELEAHGPALEVRLVGPPVPAMVQQALSVRALDAVRSCTRTFADVAVAYVTVV